MSLSGIRTTLGAALTGIGLTPYNKYPDTITVPCAIVSLRPDKPVEYDLTAKNGLYVYHFQIEVLVNKGASIAEAQVDLDPYIDPSDSTHCIKKIIEAATFTDAQIEWVKGGIAYGPATFRGIEYLGCRFEIDIWCNA